MNVRVPRPEAPGTEAAGFVGRMELTKQVAQRGTVVV
jgi:hypothetical protein